MLPGATWSTAASSGSEQQLISQAKVAQRKGKSGERYMKYRSWKTYVCIGLQILNKTGEFEEDISCQIQERSVQH